MLVLVVLSYFGITLLVEQMNPDVKEMTSSPRITGTKLHANGISDQIIGKFKIDRAASEAWLTTQANLDADSRLYFASLHTSQTQFTFDGSSIWFIDQIADIPVEVITNDGQSVKLKMLKPSSEHKGSTTFFLQSEDSGGVWYSNYSHLGDGQRKLYRARYIKVAQ